MLSVRQFFTHERGLHMGWYSLSLSGSAFFAPVICGFIAEYAGWRWVFWVPAIWSGAACVFLFFFMEETNYTRDTTAFLATTTATSEFNDKAENLDAEKQDAATAGTTPHDHHTPQQSGSKKTFVQKLSLWHSFPLSENPLKKSFRIVKYLGWPVIFYAGFSYGSYLIWFNVMAGTTSIVLGGAPYDFGPSMVGTSWLSSCIGVVLATLFTGRFSDWLTLRLARRNNGIMEAEHRLYPFLVTTIMVPAALILWGVGAAHYVHWFGLVFAMGVLAFTSTAGITLSLNYLVDSYHGISGEALASAILVRNTMSFAIGYGITPWIENLGYQNCFISAAFVGLAACLVYVVMLKWGKTFRERSAGKYWEIGWLPRNSITMTYDVT